MAADKIKLPAPSFTKSNALAPSSIMPLSVNEVAAFVTPIFVPALPSVTVPTTVLLPALLTSTNAPLPSTPVPLRIKLFVR